MVAVAIGSSVDFWVELASIPSKDHFVDARKSRLDERAF
jgi:hypothetical protein